MAWIESHDDIWDHYKTIRLCGLLGLPDVTVVGHLTSLWHFVLRNAWRDANLEKWGEAGIARGARWTGDPKVFVEALRSAGFLDGWAAHGWMERAGRLVAERFRNEVRKGSGRPTADLPPYSGGRPAATVPNRTEPNRTEPDQTEEPGSPKATEPTSERGKKALEALSKCRTVQIPDPSVLDAWAEAYPHVDLGAEILKAEAWAATKRVRRSPKGWARTLNSWLAKEQDRAVPGGRAAPPPAAPGRVVGGAKPVPGKYDAIS